jgi:hypothetical protein
VPSDAASSSEAERISRSNSRTIIGLGRIKTRCMARY